MEKIIFSGFGGQGVLTLGQIVASIALNKGLNTTWIPSYGAEMRGGTANCSVIISEKVIGSPIVSRDADILVAMNNPSVDKFINTVRSGGTVIINSSIVDVEITRTDVTVIKVDATNISVELGNPKVQNMVMLGGYLKASGKFSVEDAEQCLNQKFGAKNAKLIPLNMEAIKKGLA